MPASIFRTEYLADISVVLNKSVVRDQPRTGGQLKDHTAYSHSCLPGAMRLLDSSSTEFLTADPKFFHLKLRKKSQSLSRAIYAYTRVRTWVWHTGVQVYGYSHSIVQVYVI